MTRRKSASDLLRDDYKDVEDAIMAERRERDERHNGPADPPDPVAAANERIMADLGRALDMALPAERPYCSQCLTLFAAPGSRLCEGCAKDNAMDHSPHDFGDEDDFAGENY